MGSARNKSNARGKVTFKPTLWGGRWKGTIAGENYTRDVFGVLGAFPIQQVCQIVYKLGSLKVPLRRTREDVGAL
jgi:hypothetical protein